MKIMVIQGPNLNMLGQRDPRIYGTMTMAQIHEQMSLAAKESNVDIEFYQSNYEGEIIDKIQECVGTCDAIIINAGGYTHTSVAIADAIAATRMPVIEVHISNIYAREDFRAKSFLSPVCAGTISGFGPFSYHLALLSAIQMIQQQRAFIAAQEEALKNQNNA
ncbi:type II 3-dehydroquinate dehydratase [Campylobacter sp. Cr9]|uniref:type II 3-dehydroquinate dehydratase n=1 Tax=unclassified Campylobacter TaxID=2593542 RepID=UPI001EFB1AD2|nr:type II 3-dehydroquinate dehydratase [Campylobacter sp. RM5004]MBZ7986211.1 type II 3-dehydroquinate dehydratase [Campylobacter sp. Cr9]ULO01992.1 3-dehydroquinate dehydratase [Campylobacter sp. RM5004]